MRLQISFDIVQDILVQGDHIKDVLQQLQDAVYLTKVGHLSFIKHAFSFPAQYGKSLSYNGFLSCCEFQPSNQAWGLVRELSY